jgi:hypothetical protein
MGATSIAAIGYGRARLRLQFREFINNVNFSLNIVRDNKLAFRTIREVQLIDIFPNNESKARQISITNRLHVHFLLNVKP